MGGCSSVPQYWLLEYTSKAPSGSASPGKLCKDLNKEGKEAAPAGANLQFAMQIGIAILGMEVCGKLI